MSLVSAESELIRLCGKAGLDDGRRTLLEAVLAASDPEAVLTRHASSQPTVVAAIARAHSSLESRARPGRAKGAALCDPHARLGRGRARRTAGGPAPRTCGPTRQSDRRTGLDQGRRYGGTEQSGGLPGEGRACEDHEGRRVRSRRRRIRRGMAGTRGGGHWTTARARDRCPVHHGRPTALLAQR